MILNRVFKIKILTFFLLFLPINTYCGKFDILTTFLSDHKKEATYITAGTSVLLGTYWIYKKYAKPSILKISEEEKLPIIFHNKYDISFFGIEKVHPFDSSKYGKVFSLLKELLNKQDQHFHNPQHQISQEDLLKVHPLSYLDSLNKSLNVEKIAEVPFLRFIPNFLLQWRLLSPMRYATQGTIDAAQLALRRGIGINLSGGYHHAKSKSGGGFCVYADIPLAIKKLREDNPDLKVLYIDLDAHQGNGVEECLKDDKKTYIIDCYNEGNYPWDKNAATRINAPLKAEDIYCEDHKDILRGRGFVCHACNDIYLTSLRNALTHQIDFKPDIIFYNAGTDCFEEDLIGAMALTKQGIIDRDEVVFQFARNNNIPLCMTLSGGYSNKSASIIAHSIRNLHKKGLLNPLNHIEKEK